MTDEGNGVIKREIVVVATSLAIVQSVIWIPLSIISICMYENAISFSIPDDESEAFFIQQFYLTKVTSHDEREIDAEKFNYFMYIYTVLSFIWLIDSVWLLTETMRKKLYNRTTYQLGLWASVAILLSIADAVLMSLLSYDLSQFMKTMTNDSEHHTMYNVFWILIPASARGFVFLILNFTFACLLFKYCGKLSKSAMMTRRPLGVVYDTTNSRASTIPWTSQTNLNPLAGANEPKPQLNGLYDNFSFVRSQSFAALETPDQTDISIPLGENISIKPTSTFGRNETGNAYDNPIPRRPFSVAKATKQDFSARPLSESNLADSMKTFGKDNIHDSTVSLPNNSNRTATIGRPGRRSPPKNVPPPYIPPPDYTPPGSPQTNLKSALKPRSNYT